METPAPFYQDPAVTLYQGDALDILAALPDESVHCVVTSPPYWGLRKYSGQQERVWGGQGDCEHEWDAEVVVKRGHPSNKSTLVGTQTAAIPKAAGSQGQTCRLCEAWRGAYGLEPLHDCLGWARGERCNACYVCHSLACLDALWRVLREDGVVFWNAGDSYAGSWGNYHPTGKGGQRPKATERFQREALGDKSFKPPQADVVRWQPGAGRADGVVDARGQRNRDGAPHAPGLKPKDMVLIPQRVALAAQAAGWWVRSMIVWAKPNPMPESVTDRPTSAYEHILMLTKSERYYWDQEAVREPIAESTISRVALADSRLPTGDTHKDGSLLRGDGTPYKRGEGRMASRGAGYGADHLVARPGSPNGRNLRDVWIIATEPYSGAHFATFPEALVERCILAATSERGVCQACGAPWERVVEKGLTAHDGKTGSAYAVGTTANRLARLRQAARKRGGEYANDDKTIGWEPSCECEVGEPPPATVLDPFVGSGTTLSVAKRLGRRSIGVELSEEYCRLAVKRVEAETARMV